MSSLLFYKKRTTLYSLTVVHFIFPIDRTIILIHPNSHTRGFIICPLWSEFPGPEVISGDN